MNNNPSSCQQIHFCGWSKTVAKANWKQFSEISRIRKWLSQAYMSQTHRHSGSRSRKCGSTDKQRASICRESMQRYFSAREHDVFRQRFLKLMQFFLCFRNVPVCSKHSALNIVYELRYQCKYLGQKTPKNWGFCLEDIFCCVSSDNSYLWFCRVTCLDQSHATIHNNSKFKIKCFWVVS